MNTVHIDKYIAMVNANEQTRQPQVKMSMQDAKNLRDNITVLLSYVIKKQDELIDTQNKLYDAQNITNPTSQTPPPTYHCHSYNHALTISSTNHTTSTNTHAQTHPHNRTTPNRTTKPLTTQH